MKCKVCFGEIRLFRQIFANGTAHITQRCSVCGTLADKYKPFLPNDTVADINSLPVWGIATEVIKRQQEPLPRSKPQPIYHHLNLRRP